MKKGHWKIPMYKELAYVKTDLKIIKLNCEIVQDRKREMQSFVGDHRYPPDKWKHMFAQSYMWTFTAGFILVRTWAQPKGLRRWMYKHNGVSIE